MKAAKNAQGKSARKVSHSPKSKLQTKFMYEEFCQQYLIDGDGQAAALRSGYAKSGAKVASCRLLKKPEIVARIEELKAKRLMRVTADADYVLRRLVEIDQMDISDIMDGQGYIYPIDKWPEVWRKTLTAFEVSELFAGSGDERAVSGYCGRHPPRCERR